MIKGFMSGFKVGLIEGWGYLYLQLFYGDDMIVLCVADLDELDTLDASFYTLKQLGLRADLCTIKLLLVGHAEDPQSVAIMLATAMLSKGYLLF